MKLLLVADDFGVNIHRTTGILEALQSNVVHSISVLPNGECTEYMLRKGAEDYGLKPTQIGVHLNITEGPSLARDLNSSLVDENGFFLGKIAVREKLFTGEITRADVESELNLQVQFLNSIICGIWGNGHRVTHCDGHNHVYTAPEILKYLPGFLYDLGLRSIRCPIDWEVEGLDIPVQEFETLLRQNDFVEQMSGSPFHARVSREAVLLRTVFASHGFVIPASFSGLSMLLSPSPEMLSTTLSPPSLSSCGVYEVMTHIGHTAPLDPNTSAVFFNDWFSRSKNRDLELELWKSAYRDGLYSAFDGVADFGDLLKQT
eukprot:TRINITY_DN37425_c0_g1_i1.p1 TRINITY_DN37425_c0_g1~~TRINITY_DN37425_c0_g1_i1.p1  ORF type:complete len:317 (+),score=24.12 TRINITY_DN37425_c0_g1_i1:2-952(+)